jgi:hypothetical protein
MAGVSEVLPCSQKIINGYVSWLYKSPTGEIGIWIASDYRKDDQIMTWVGAFDWRNPKAWRHCLDHVAIISHEVGHLLLKHQGLDISVLPKGINLPPMDKTDEWEAWLFSKMFCAFILADHSFESKAETGIDKAADLFLHSNTTTDLRRR